MALPVISPIDNVCQIKHCVDNPANYGVKALRSLFNDMDDDAEYTYHS